MLTHALTQLSPGSIIPTNPSPQKPKEPCPGLLALATAQRLNYKCYCNLKRSDQEDNLVFVFPLLLVHAPTTLHKYLLAPQNRTFLRRT